jgi:hypothetical protein
MLKRDGHHRPGMMHPTLRPKLSLRPLLAAREKEARLPTLVTFPTVCGLRFAVCVCAIGTMTIAFPLDHSWSRFMGGVEL